MRAPGPEDRRIAAALRELDRAQTEMDRLSLLLVSASTSQAVGITRRLRRVLTALTASMHEWTQTGLASLFGPAHSGLTRHALAVLKADTFGDLAAATQFVTQDIKRMTRAVAKRRVYLHVVKGLSVPDSKRRLTKDLDKIGLRFIDKSGRAWKLDRYAEMVVRTKSAQAYNTGTILRGTEIGITEFKVFDGTGDPACAEANGQIWKASKCLDEPVAHPNCVRAFAGVMS